MERPNNVPQYDDVDLKLGIKSSLPNVKETLALFLLMWRSCGKASVLDYCVSDGNNLKVEPTLLGNLHTAVRNVSSEEECSFEQLDALIANNQMFKSQLEALIVAFELVWKIAKIRFVDDNKPSSAERTGGKRYPKRLWFTVNMDLIDLLFESAPKDYTRVLLRWLGVNIPPATDAEKSLLQILTVFSEGAVYKLIDGESDVIFNLNSLYEKLLSTVDELDINGDKEAKGSLRVLKSALSDGMNPYLKYKSGTVSLSEDTGELQHYSDRVNTFLSLSTSRVLGLDEGGTLGTNGELYTGAGVNSEFYIDENETTDIALNTILYGPPGTGKTYHTVIYAVAIIENRELASVEAENYPDVLHRYNEYKAQGRIEFTTFHQSYGYEEFIEGIKPSVDSEEESGDIQYSVQPGGFKRFCERADCPVAANAETYGIRENPNIWKVSLWSTGDNEIRSECLSGGHIRIGWDQYGKDITDEIDFSEDGGRVVLNAFINRMQVGDVVFSCYSASTIDAIGVVTGDYEWHEEYEYFRRLRKVNWIVKGMQENILDINGGTSMTLVSVYRLASVALPDVYQLIDKYRPAQGVPVPAKKENYVFIIDEINRGNISKVFGELITLIEESKRVGKQEGMKVILPYSQKPFGVPQNVYIIGTMNTADRSIATIDTALRRRFFFKEMLPDASVLEGIEVEDLNISELLIRMNKRISVLYDREHTIGHAYFMPLKSCPTTEKLSEIFSNNIIPLLQEYFYEDYEKIRLVLGDNRKTDENEQFVVSKVNDYSELFGESDIGLDDGNSYEINKAAFGNIAAYHTI